MEKYKIKSIAKKLFIGPSLFFMILGLVVFMYPLRGQPSASFSPSPIFSPYIKNYLPKDYRSSPQNWAIVEDTRGILYFGNNSGILEFDGVDWRLIPTAGVGVRSLCRDSSGKIMVGGVGQIGYLRPDSLGNLRFFSLVHNISSPYTHFKDVWFTQATRDAVFFVTDSVVYQWKNGKFTYYKVPISRYTSCNVFHGKLMLGLENGSIYQIYQEKLELFYEGRKLGAKITALLPYHSEALLICTSDRGLFTLEAGNIKPIRDNFLNEFFKQSDIWQGLRLPDGNYALATLRKGAILLSPELEFIQAFQKATGLNNDEITAVWLDRYNDLWVTTYFGISRIEIYSAVSFADENSGLHGSITALAEHQEKLWVGTTFGVFYQFQNRFEAIQGLRAEVWALCSTGDALFAATNKGVFEVSQGQAVRVVAGVANALFYSNKDPHVLYIGFRDGLGTLHRQKNQWSFVTRHPEINSEIRKILRDESNTLWLETYANGIIRLAANSPPQTLGTESGLPSLTGNKIFNYQNKILVWTELGAHIFDEQAQLFFPDTTFPSEINDLTAVQSLNFLLPEPTKKGYWVNISLTNDINSLGWIENNKYKQRFLRKNFIVDAFYVQQAGKIVWMGSQSELVRFNSTVIEDHAIKNAVIIRNVIVGKGQIIFAGALHDNQGNLSLRQFAIPQIEYANNTIRFGYALPVYKTHAAVEYQYFLEGFSKEWSDFTTETYQTFTNLPEGRYTFRVRARNLYGYLSQEASFHFIILPPWYRTWWAYILWVVSASGLIYGLIRWRIKALERENRILEAKVAQRTAQLQAANEALFEEKKKSDALLLNILPFETAEELKSTGRAEPRNYAMVSVLFTDFVNFTAAAARLTPNQLISELQACFTAFDDITVQRGLEKIKTIGDAYMCAGGIPKPNVTNPIDTVLAGLQMQEFMVQYIQSRQDNWAGWYARLGIHTGPIVAGVVGKKKYAYDIWGDTVNIASRIESMGEANKVNISEVTYGYVKDFFTCTYRGKLPIKNKGEIGMYFVEGIKPELSVNGEGKIPNEKFWQKLEEWKAQFKQEVINP